MALPKVKHPIFKLAVPSTGQTISYRPFTVQEEKLLLIVRMSDDIDEIIETVKQVVGNCILDDVDIDKLAMFDVEYIFINLRRVSVGNIVDLIYTEDEKKYPFQVNLEDIKPPVVDAKAKNIDLGDGLGMVMKFPNMSSVIKVEFDLKVSLFTPEGVDESIFEMILSCVDYVYDENAMYKEFTKDELRDFIMSLSIDNLTKIHTFFKNLPSVEYEAEVDVKGETRRVALRGMKDFFSF